MKVNKRNKKRLHLPFQDNGTNKKRIHITYNDDGSISDVKDRVSSFLEEVNSSKCSARLEMNLSTISDDKNNDNKLGKLKGKSINQSTKPKDLESNDLWYDAVETYKADEDNLDGQDYECDEFVDAVDSCCPDSEIVIAASNSTKAISAKSKRKKYNPKLIKYWAQRYRLFSRFDQGIQIDDGQFFLVS